MNSLNINSLSFLRAFTGAFSPDRSGNLWAPAMPSVPSGYHQLFEPGPAMRSELLTPDNGKQIMKAAEDLYHGLFDPNRLGLRGELKGRSGALFTTKGWRIPETPDGLEVSTSQYESQTGEFVPWQLSKTLGFVIDNPIERRRVGFSRFQNDLLCDVSLVSDRGTLFQRAHLLASGESTTVQYTMASENPSTILGKRGLGGAEVFDWASRLLLEQFPGETIHHVSAYRVFPNGISKPLFENPLVFGATLFTSLLASHLDKALAGRWTVSLCFFMKPEYSPRWAQTLTVGKSNLTLNLSNPYRAGLMSLKPSALDYFSALRNDIEDGRPVSRNVN